MRAPGECCGSHSLHEHAYHRDGFDRNSRALLTSAPHSPDGPMPPQESPAAVPHASASRPPSFFGLGRAGLVEQMARVGEPDYRADQLMTWIYRRRVRDPHAMSDLPAELRERLSGLCDLDLPAVDRLLGDRSGDTFKFVLRLRDGERVECVSMRTERRLTLCLST